MRSTSRADRRILFSGMSAQAHLSKGRAQCAARRSLPRESAQRALVALPPAIDPAAALGTGHGLRASALCATGTESAPRARAPAQPEAAKATPARVLSAATGPGTEEQRSSVLKLPLAATMQMPRCGNANAPGGTRLKLRSREERSSALITCYTLCH